MINDKELRELATHYIWHDYVDAESEFEEVSALVSLLQRVQKDAIEFALKTMREEGLGPFVLRHMSRKLLAGASPDQQ